MRNKRETLDKWQLQNQANNNQNNGIYTYTHKQNQNSPTKVKQGRLTQGTKEIKHYIYQLRTKPTKVQTEKQN